jgi:hypothetical protein
LGYVVHGLLRNAVDGTSGARKKKKHNNDNNQENNTVAEQKSNQNVQDFFFVF